MSQADTWGRASETEGGTDAKAQGQGCLSYSSTRSSSLSLDVHGEVISLGPLAVDYNTSLK